MISSGYQEDCQDSSGVGTGECNDKITWSNNTSKTLTNQLEPRTLHQQSCSKGELFAQVKFDIASIVLSDAVIFSKMENNQTQRK